MHFCTVREIIFLVGGPWKSNVVLERPRKVLAKWLEFFVWNLFIPSILKRVRRRRVSWARSIDVTKNEEIMVLTCVFWWKWNNQQDRTGFEPMTSQTPGGRSILCYEELMEREAIYQVHILHASCILLGSAMSRSYCMMKERKVMNFLCFLIVVVVFL